MQLNRFRACASVAVAVALVALPVAEAQSVTIASPSSDVAQYAAAWQVAQMALRFVPCHSRRCSDAVAAVMGVGAAYDRGEVLAAAATDRLTVAIGALNLVYRHDHPVEYAQGASAGVSAYNVGRGAPSDGLIALDSDGCENGCNSAATFSGLACTAISLLNPVLGAGCFLSVAACYLQCMSSCKSGRNGNAENALQPILDGVRQSDGAALLAALNASQLSQAGGRLAPYVPAAQLNAALSMAGRALAANAFSGGQ